MRAKHYATVVVLIFLIITGCAHYGALEEDYGKSYHAAKTGQILNPGASKNLAPVTGLLGTAADGTIKKYAESFAPDGQATQQATQQTPQGSACATGTGQDAYGKK